ncbi:MAG TPA: response regulator [Chloroflexia bacterium]|nr:response regulator [Chloroflexia bacterium]
MTSEENLAFTGSSQPRTERKKTSAPLNSPANTEKQARILVVDDDPDILTIISFTLRREGFLVQEAKNGQEALNLLEDFAPDVLCIDFMMPGMDGKELTREVRKRQGMIYVPIIMLTAAGQHQVKIDSLNSGVDAFLTKPVAKEELKVTIRTLLRMKAAQDRMLEALDRVAEVQDELFKYERQQGRYDAIRATITTVTNELRAPLNEANVAVMNLETLIDIAQSGRHDIKTVSAMGQTYLESLKKALQATEGALVRLNQSSETAILQELEPEE